MTLPSDEPERTIPRGPDAMRRRPEMYVGSLGPRGLMNLAHEALDNAVEEAGAGYARRVDVPLHSDGSLSVADDGRGLPVAPDPETGEPTASRVLTNWDRRAARPYPEPRLASSNSSCGVSVVNGLSRWLELSTAADGSRYRQRFERAVPITHLEAIGDAAGRHATTLRWLPDPEIFGAETHSVGCLRNRLRTLACLVPELRLSLTDEAEGSRLEFHQPGGMEGLLELANTGRWAACPPIRLRHRSERFHLDGALQYYASYEPIPSRVLAFANHREVDEGGWTMQGLQCGLSSAIRDAAAANPDLQHPQSTHSWQEISTNLCIALSIRIVDPRFEGAMKQRLSADDPAELRNEMAAAVLAGVTEHLEGDPSLRKSFLRSWVRP